MAKGQMVTSSSGDDHSSDSNELSDVNISGEEDLDLDDMDREDQELDHPEDDDLDEAEKAEEEEEPEYSQDAEDFEDADDIDVIPETNYDGNDIESDDSDELGAPILAPKRSTRPKRETKKRQLTFYEEDDLLDSDGDRPAPRARQANAPAPRQTSTRALRAKMERDDFSELEPEYKPNLQKLTERQRAKLEEDPNEKYEELMFARMDQQLLALNRKTVKRIETAEQAALRRAENARKRAHYKVKQLEEAKRDTLNKLLKRRATKTREKEANDMDEPKLTLKPRRPVVGHPALLRWVSRPEGSLLAASEASFFKL